MGVCSILSSLVGTPGLVSEGQARLGEVEVDDMKDIHY
jgi:hypothetical protein